MPRRCWHAWNNREKWRCSTHHPSRPQRASTRSIIVDCEATMSESDRKATLERASMALDLARAELGPDAPLADVEDRAVAIMLADDPRVARLRLRDLRQRSARPKAS